MRLALLYATGIALPACNDTPMGDSSSGVETGDGDGTSGTGTTGDEAPCGGDPRAIELGIEAPLSPGGYETPNHSAVVYVENSSELLEALEQAPAGSHTDIVLRDGSFTTAGVSEAQGGVALHGHRLWAEHSGKVTIAFGFHAMGDDSLEVAAELHGIHFDVSDIRYVHESEADAGYPLWYIIYSDSAAGAHLRVEDCRFSGDQQLSGALMAKNASGVALHRLAINAFTYSGVVLGRGTQGPQPGESSTPTAQLTDLDIAGIWRPSEGGGPEVPVYDQWGLRLLERATVSRVRIRDAFYGGIKLGGRTEGSHLTHIDIDLLPGIPDGTSWAGSTAISFAEESHDVELERFCVGPETRIGVNGEWHGEPIPRLHAVRPEVHHGLILSQRFGVHFDAGSVAASIHDLTIDGFQRAGIVFFQNLVNEEDLDQTPIDPADPDPPNPSALWESDASSQFDNVFVPGCTEAPQLWESHWNASPLCE